MHHGKTNGKTDSIILKEIHLLSMDWRQLMAEAVRFELTEEFPLR
jgi:hypothetical protein